MGCCASKGAEINHSPRFYHATGELQPLSSHHGRGSTVSTGLLVDTNLDTSIPETYRPPPVPVPYETCVGHPQTLPGSHEISGDKDEGARGVNKPAEETNSAHTQPTTVKDVKPDGNVQNDVEVAIVKEVVNDLEKSGDLKKPTESIVSLLEEDVCPTCLEEYDDENPKITTKCEHYFHLACILEWMERSDTCPVCGQEMIYSTANQS